MTDFIEFPKIARLNRECVATEKIDGTNASVFVGIDGEFLVGSRTRWITPEQDNHGFARWAYENREELTKLGPGMHYGEWWGYGVQRGYGLQKGEKRFSLFNVGRWGNEREAACRKCHLSASTWAPDKCTRCDEERPAEPPRRPACCGVVPVLARGLDIREVAESALARLREAGSVAAPGFDKPEGIVIFHTAARRLFKVTLERDEAPKGRP